MHSHAERGDEEKGRRSWVFRLSWEPLAFDGLRCA